jgi:ribosome-associated toxin RatA of RatAB toxin-antitoxin module
MTLVTRSALVPYQAEQMFALVNDINAYPEFLPWCHGAEVLRETEMEIHASLMVGKGGVKQEFATCNVLTRPSRIDMSLKNGPFQKLEGYWQFDGLGDADFEGCKATLFLEFEFANPLIAAMFGATFKSMADSLLDAFIQRAKDQYG